MQTSQLPVSADYVDKSTHVWGLPHQLPSCPNVPVSPNLQPLLPLLVGYLRKELQDNVDKSRPRSFLYNLYSVNNFENQDFIQAVAGLAEYVEMLLLTRPALQQNPEATIAQCATEIATIMSCVYAKKYREIYQSLSDQNRQDIEVWLNKYTQIKQAIEQMHIQHGNQFQNQAPQQQWGGQQSQQPMNPMNPMAGQGWNQQPQQMPQQQWGQQQMPQQPQWGAQPQQMQQGMSQHWGGQPPAQPQQQWAQVDNMGRPVQPMGQPQGNWMPPMQGNQPAGQFGGVQNPHFPQQHSRQQMGGPDMFQMGGSQNGGIQSTPSLRTSLKPRSRTQQEQPQEDDLRQQTKQPGYVLETFGDEGYQDYRNEPTRRVDATRPLPGQPGHPGYVGNNQSLPGVQAVPKTNGNLQSRMTKVEKAPVAPSEEQPQFTDPERPFDHFVYKGEEFCPAFKSGWTKTFSLEQPYRVAYNPAEEVLYHVKNSAGEVREVLQPLGEGMDYLKNELNSELRRNKAKLEIESGPKVVPTWDVMEAPTEVSESEEISEDVAVDIRSGAKPVVVKDVIQAYSAAHAKLLHEVRLIERGVAGDNTELRSIPKEYYYQEITPMRVHGVDRENVVKVLNGLSEADSVESMIQMLVDLHGNLDSDLWNTIHDRMTKRVNDILAYHIQLSGWEIDSISDDWSELRGAMMEEFGETTGAGLFKTLETVGHKDLVEGATGVLANVGKNVIDTLGVSDEARKELERSLVVFTENVSVTHVPWNLEEDTLALDNEGSAILESRLPELYKLVSGIFERTDGKNITFRHRFIETLDGSKYELHRGYLGKEYFLLRLAD